VLSRRISSPIWAALGERLAVVGEIVYRKAKGPFVKSECLMVQRDFQQERGVSDSSSNSRAAVEARQPETALQALL